MDIIEILSPLGLEFKLLFIQLVGFLILLWMLKKFLFGRVLDMIQRRGDEIRNAYEENDRTREEVKVLQNEYSQKLQQARKEAEDIIQAATARAEKAGQEILEKTRQEADDLRKRGLADIEQEKKKVISEVRTDVINLSVEIARRLIEKSIEPRDAERLADDVISRLGGATS
jgi:F-type H+-transporting ATPase subunit b